MILLDWIYDLDIVTQEAVIEGYSAPARIAWEDGKCLTKKVTNEAWGFQTVFLERTWVTVLLDRTQLADR